jgi:hypothetical protein
MFCVLFPDATCGLVTEGEAKECSKDNQLPSSEAWARQVQVILRPLLPFHFSGLGVGTAIIFFQVAL